MIQNLTKKFCDIDYRHNRRSILYERKKCYLPKISTILREKDKLKQIEEQGIDFNKQLDILKEEIERQYISIIQSE